MKSELLKKSKRPVIFMVGRAHPPQTSASIILLALLVRFCKRPYEIVCIPSWGEDYSDLNFGEGCDVICVDWSSMFPFFQLQTGVYNPRETTRKERDETLLRGFYSWLRKGKHRLGILDHWCCGKWAEVLRFWHECSEEEVWIEHANFYAQFPPEWAFKQKLLQHSQMGSPLNTLADIIGEELHNDIYAWELAHELLNIEGGLVCPLSSQIEEAYNGFSVAAQRPGAFTDMFPEFLNHCVELLANKKPLSGDVQIFEWNALLASKKKLFRDAVENAKDLGDGIVEIPIPILRAPDSLFPDYPNITDIYLELMNSVRAVVGVLPEACTEKNCRLVIYSLQDVSLFDLLFDLPIEVVSPEVPHWIVCVPLDNKNEVLGILRQSLQNNPS